MYEEIMALWKIGDMNKLALYLNSKGIYSAMNPNHPDRHGSYTWVRTERADGVNTSFNLLVMGVMLFPSHLRYTNKASSLRGDSK